MHCEILNPQSDDYTHTYLESCSRVKEVLAAIGLTLSCQTQWGVFTAGTFPLSPIRFMVTSVMVDTDNSIVIEVSARSFKGREIRFLRYSEDTGWQMFFADFGSVVSGNFRF